MGRKKAAATQPESESAETSAETSGGAGEEQGAGGSGKVSASDSEVKAPSKSELAGRIVRELPEASVAELLAEFAKRHPQIDWKSGDVNNGKTWLEKQGDGVPR